MGLPLFTDALPIKGVRGLAEAELHWLTQTIGSRPARAPETLDELSQRIAHLDVALRLCGAHDLSPDNTTVHACQMELERRHELACA